jgi:hypothetical protein
LILLAVISFSSFKFYILIEVVHRTEFKLPLRQQRKALSGIRRIRPLICPSTARRPAAASVN